jgi:hypothetical protein
MEFSSPARMMAAYEQRRLQLRDRLHAFLTTKTKSSERVSERVSDGGSKSEGGSNGVINGASERVSEGVSSGGSKSEGVSNGVSEGGSNGGSDGVSERASEGVSEGEGKFVHKVLSNHEKLHFYALVELLRLDFREDLMRVASGCASECVSECVSEQVAPQAEQAPVLDEAFLKDTARFEADLTALLTSIGSLECVHHSHTHSLRLLGWVDDASRLLGAWLIFCVTALLFPLPFLVLKGVRVLGVEWYSTAALRFNSVVCGLVLRVSALGVDLRDERSPRGLALMDSRRSVTCYNHTSTIDAFVLPVVSSHFSFMLAKKELFALPFFSWLLAVFGGIPVSE